MEQPLELRPYEVTFASPYEKAQYLDSRASLDAHLPAVREFAGRYARARGANDPEGIVLDLHRFWRDAIRYVHDPSWEEFADTETILNRGYDDCDGKSRGFVACLRAIGIEARIQPVFDRAGNFVHVQAGVRWPGSEHWRNAEADGWVRAELILHDCELGDDPNALPRGAYGRRVYT